MANSTNNSRRNTTSRSGNTAKRSSSSSHRSSSSNRSGSGRSGSTSSRNGASTNRSGSMKNSNNSGRTNSNRVNGAKSGKRNKRKLRQQRIKMLIMAAEVLLIIVLVVSGVMFFLKHKGNTIETAVKEEEPVVGVKVDGIDISQLTKEQARNALINRHPWNMTITYEGNVYEVENLFEKEIDSVLYDAYAPNAQPEYTITITNPDVAAQTIAKEVSDMWSQPAIDATITGYSDETGEFILSESQPGYVVDVETLSAAISKELVAGNYMAAITATGEASAPAFSKSDYKILGTYKTTTTANENRNTNVRIACETICGTILQPQEQFSYNSILGRRTGEKGYKEAPAYSNGETVQEFGGGICQVSSTIYNATIGANLQIDKRTGHTYAPTYVTPGEDAAVSYENPDFVFTNNTGATLGIKTVYGDRTIVATIFGVSTLEEGVTRYLRSEKIEDLPPPPDRVVEDPTLMPGETRVVAGPSNGSKWATYVILEKDGEVISEEYLHTTTYRGHTGEIHVNNTGVVDPATFAAMVAQQQAEQQAAEAAQQAAQ